MGVAGTAASFTAERPFVLGLIAKDFRGNDTGLEYIGTRRQQMGDGGVILQVKNSDGETIAITIVVKSKFLTPIIM